MGLRRIATLWIGDRLGPVQAVCLARWVALGQPVRLYTYGPVSGVPQGVEVGDAGAILPDAGLIYRRRESPALQADLFRLHLLVRQPGIVWADADLYPLHPLDCTDAVLLAQDGNGRVGTALVALPAQSALLADMLAHTGDPHAIPPYAKPALRRSYLKAKAAGQAVHVSDQTYGIWGPMLWQHFVKKHGMAGLVRPICAIAGDTVQMPDPVWGEAMAVHLGGAGRLRPKPGSWLARILAVPQAPPSSGEVSTIALIGAAGATMAAELQSRHGSEITLVDIDAAGTFGAAWAPSARADLIAAGVPAERIRLAGSLAALKPCDLVLCLEYFGDGARLRPLGVVLPALMHADSRLIVDIRKGSGGFGFIKAFGETSVLSRHERDGAEVARVELRPKPPEPAGNDESWGAIARTLAGPNGFYRANALHSFLYMPRGRTLVVTFDNLDIAMAKREDRRPWGFSFIEKQGWSMLGVMANGWTWYRDPWVSAQFDDLAASGFFGQFDRVVFYGASMGGYAACAFSGAAPGADVFAISPQSTVDRSVVPWETRYRSVWGADFSGKHGDAALVSGAARRVTLLYDPFEPLDAAHAARFAAPNVMKLRANLLGHRLGSSLQQMGILQPITLAALGGTLTEAEFYRRLRARRSFPRYQRELFDRLVARGHPGLARLLGAWVLAQGDNRAIRAAMAAL